MKRYFRFATVLLLIALLFAFTSCDFLLHLGNGNVTDAPSSEGPTDEPTDEPTETETETDKPTEKPTEKPTSKPTTKKEETTKQEPDPIVLDQADHVLLLAFRSAESSGAIGLADGDAISVSISKNDLGAKDSDLLAYLGLADAEGTWSLARSGNVISAGGNALPNVLGALMLGRDRIAETALTEALAACGTVESISLGEGAYRFPDEKMTALFAGLGLIDPENGGSARVEYVKESGAVKTVSIYVKNDAKTNYENALRGFLDDDTFAVSVTYTLRGESASEIVTKVALGECELNGKTFSGVFTRTDTVAAGRITDAEIAGSYKTVCDLPDPLNREKDGPERTVVSSVSLSLTEESLALEVSATKTDRDGVQIVSTELPEVALSIATPGAVSVTVGESIVLNGTV